MNKMALRSIENIASSRLTLNRKAAPKSFNLRLFDMDSSEDDQILTPKASTTTTATATIAASSKSLLKVKRDKPAATVATGRGRKRKNMDENDDNEKENKRPALLQDGEQHGVVVSSSRAPSGSSITIVRRSKRPLEDTTNISNRVNQQPVVDKPNQQEEQPGKMAKSQKRAVATKEESVAVTESPRARLLRSNHHKAAAAFALDDSSVDWLSLEPIPMPTKEETKDFDYFMHLSMNNTDGEVLTPKRSRTTNRKQKETKPATAASLYDLEDNEFDEDKSTKLKYNKDQKDPILSLFESDEQEKTDDDEEKVTIMGNTSSRRQQRRTTRKSGADTSKKSLLKLTKSRHSANKTKSKSHRKDDNDDEVEKQLQAAAKEYEEIKNHQLIVESKHSA